MREEAPGHACEGTSVIKWQCDLSGPSQSFVSPSIKEEGSPRPLPCHWDTKRII